MMWTWEVVSRLAAAMVYGGLMHLLDVPIRQLSNEKVRRLSRYGAGTVCALPAFLATIELLLDVAGIATAAHERRRLLWIITSAYVLSFIPIGVGVVIAYFLEQILGDGSE